MVTYFSQTPELNPKLFNLDMVVDVQSTLSRTDTFGTGTSCPS